MEKKATNITPQMEFESQIFHAIWDYHGEHTVSAPDGTTAVIPRRGDERDTEAWGRAEKTFMRVASRGPVSLHAQEYGTGTYKFFPMFVESEVSANAVRGILERLVQGRECGFVGTMTMKYRDRLCVLAKAEIRNIPSAPKLIGAFVRWMSAQIGADVTTSDRIPLYGGLTIPGNYDMCGMEYITENTMSAATDVWFDTAERPLPPMWISEISMTKTPDTTDTFASVGNTPIVQRGGITLISGAAKSGKTLLVSSIIASSVGRDVILGISPGSPARILWCDTEQSENDLAIVRERIEALAGTLLKNADIKGLRLRPFSPEKSTEIIENALKQYRPDILLIDGPGDLCTDTNDISASQATVKTLLRWCDEYNCATVGVVHTNPGSEKTRGHIGSEIERKCASSLITMKNDSLDSEYPTFKVKPGFMRGKSFKSYAFRYNENGLPELVDNTDSEKMNSEDRLLGELEPGFNYSYPQLLQKASESGITEGTAKSAISRLIRKGKIEKSNEGYFVIGG